MDTNHWPPGGVEGSVTVTGEEHLRRHVTSPRSKISTTSVRPTGRRAAHIWFGKNVSTVSISLEETQTGPSYGGGGKRCPTGPEKVETHFGEETKESKIQGRTLDWTRDEFQLQGRVPDSHFHPKCLYPPDICDGTTERRSGNAGWDAHEVRVLVKQFSNPRVQFSDPVSSLESRYVPALRGILVAHSNVKFLGTVAIIKADCPFANCRVSFDATVWSPLIGMKLCECLVATFSAISS